MDSFYAAIEIRDNPELADKPVAVGGASNERGVLCTCNYIARKLKVRSAMTTAYAKRLCPDLIVLPVNMQKYQQASAMIRSIFLEFTTLVEPLSLDEAYLDVTQDKQNIGSAIDIAKAIKQAIKDELQLSASAGESINKFVAKIASDMNKPDGLTFIGPSSIESFMEKLAVEKFFGVGKVTAEKMKKMGLFTGADLKQLPEDEMVKHFGKAGQFYYQIARGIDNREVQPNRETKSIGAEDTFPYDLTEIDEMNIELDRLSQTVANRLQQYQLEGRTITLKIKYSDFKQITRNYSVTEPVGDFGIISQTAKNLLLATEPEGKKIRLLGVTLSNFGEVTPKQKRTDNSDQLELF